MQVLMSCGCPSAGQRSDGNGAVLRQGCDQHEGHDGGRPPCAAGGGQDHTTHDSWCHDRLVAVAVAGVLGVLGVWWWRQCGRWCVFTIPTVMKIKSYFLVSMQIVRFSIVFPYCAPLLVFLQRAGTAVHHSYLFSFSLLLTSLSHMYSFFIFLYFSYNFLCRIIVTLTLSLCRTVPAHTGAHSDDCVCHRLLQWSAVHWRLREDHCILWLHGECCCHLLVWLFMLLFLPKIDLAHV